MSGASASKALIVAPAWVGDAVMTQPLLSRLRQYQPKLTLDVFASSWVAPVFERMEEVSNIIDNPFGHGELSLVRRYTLARQLVRSGYQYAYILPNSLKSALVPFFAKIPKRIGFTGEMRYGLINCRHHLDVTALPKMVERFARLAESPGADLPKPLPMPRLSSSLDQRLATLNQLNIVRPQSVVVFCPGAEYGPAKRWPASYFAGLSKGLAEHGYAIWIIGSPKDKSVGDEIIRLSLCAEKLENFCGKTSLSQAIDLLAAADFVVSNDSGLMHIAAALKRPLIALYGSSSPDFTPPLSEQAKIVRKELGCSPCFKRECPLKHLDCLHAITPQEVLEIFLNIDKSLVERSG